MYREISLRVYLGSKDDGILRFKTSGSIKLFDSKIAIVLIDNILFWKKLNVTAFLISGITGKYPNLIGEAYRDKDANSYLALNQQPVIIMQSDAGILKKIHRRTLDRGLQCAIYIEDMFSTSTDADNRKTVSNYGADSLPLVGIGLRAEKRLIDKIIKGATLHS